MPGLNGTGPLGQGALTGGGRGPCGRGLARGFGAGYGRGYGMGYGMGYGRGFGRGFGRGLGRGPVMQPAGYGAPADDRQAMEQRLAALEEEARLVREQLETTK